MKLYNNCPWCHDGTMKAIGTEYYPMVITHCTRCHHEGCEVDPKWWKIQRDLDAEKQENDDEVSGG